MSRRFLLALDQGTTSSRALLYNRAGEVVAAAQRELPQHFPHPGWVEHDPEAIWRGQLEAGRAALAAAGVGAEEVAALGIANQRETTVVWERGRGGRPIYPAVVWQSRQTAPLCAELRAQGHGALVRERSGLVIDSYFSAPKLRFILDAVPGAAERARRGELAFGTVDTWLIDRLTKGRVHATEASNASRTMLFDIHRGRWDPDLLALLDLPAALLPELRPAGGDFGTADAEWFGGEIPIAGVLGDQQAALFGHGCWEPGRSKNSYGTGCFFLLHTGGEAVASSRGLLTTVAWDLGDGLQYALEGSVFVAGAALQWLRDGLGLIATAAESQAAAQSVPDTGGVYAVPAFTGLGAPHWDEGARGAVLGLSRGSSRAQLIRAFLESIAYQTCDVLEAAAADAGCYPEALDVDGGACRNDFLMQFQADIAGLAVRRPAGLEVTCFGAAAMAGLAVGFWPSRDELAGVVHGGSTHFAPTFDAERREALRRGWRRAVERARGWVEVEAAPREPGAMA